MNKRIISALVLAGMITSSAAFASKGRELVLGHGGSTTGSFFYDTETNMFYNPSYVNDSKNWLQFEKNGEFGLVTSMMNLNMGLWLNRFDGTQNISSGTNANVIDFLVGGDMGVKWGLGINYGQQDAIVGAASSDTNTFMAARLGAQFSGFDPFVGFTVSGERKVGTITKTHTYKGMNAGFRYHYGEWTPYAVYNTTTDKTEAVGATVASESKTTSMVAGLGREAKLAEGVRLMYALFYSNTGRKIADVKDPSGTITALPVNVGVEADALSWLTLRAGATQTLIGTGATRATTARVGGSFHIAKVDVDYAFGNSSSTGGTSSVTPDSTDVGFDSGTFHKVGLHYSW